MPPVVFFCIKVACRLLGKEAISQKGKRYIYILPSRNFPVSLWLKFGIIQLKRSISSPLLHSPFFFIFEIVSVKWASFDSSKSTGFLMIPSESNLSMTSVSLSV